MNFLLGGLGTPARLSRGVVAIILDPTAFITLAEKVRLLERHHYRASEMSTCGHRKRTWSKSHSATPIYRSRWFVDRPSRSRLLIPAGTLLSNWDSPETSPQLPY